MGWCWLRQPCWPVYPHKPKVQRHMQVLQVSAEYFPFLKTGGLADVAGALPSALSELGCAVRPVLPGFVPLLQALRSPSLVATCTTPWGQELRVWCGELPAGGHSSTAYVLEAPDLYQRPGGPYESLDKQPHADNHRRFAALCWAATGLARGLDPTWQPDVVHCHDWHAGLVPAYLRVTAGEYIPSIFTVHNLAYQGLFARHDYVGLGLPWDWFQPEGLEFYGQWSFMKAGLYYADRLTTVSPSYAREIQTPAFGCGLDGLLRHRHAVLSGILNGIDAGVWNPETDAYLSTPYGVHSLERKAHNKMALQAELGLARHTESPLFTIVSRLTEQKGLPLVLEGADFLLQQGAQLVVLGSGDAWLEAAFQAKAQQYPGQMVAHIGYDEALAHRLFAGGDVVLVPSHFEPCGLTQLYGLAYGCVPLVRRVGGLADTVTDTNLITLNNQQATGVVFEQANLSDFTHALRCMLALYQRPADWQQVQQTGMRQPLHWSQAARAYVQLYRDALGQPA